MKALLVVLVVFLAACQGSTSGDGGRCLKIFDAETKTFVSACGE